jgi:hypothetical protein
MHRREADDTLAVVDGNQQQIRWQVLRYELVPVLSREYRVFHKIPQIGPAMAHRRVEYSPDCPSVFANSRSNRASKIARLAIALGVLRNLHDGTSPIAASALGKRVSKSSSTTASGWIAMRAMGTSGGSDAMYAWPSSMPR